MLSSCKHCRMTDANTIHIILQISVKTMFKHRKITPMVNLPHEITEVVPVSKEKDGVQRVSFVQQSCEIARSALPDPEEYTLSRLLASGEILKPLPTNILQTEPTPDFVTSLDAALTPKPSVSHETSNNQ